MNISELARRLRVTTNQLHDVLPQMGFDIGRRAIKVDNAVAQKIIHQWGKFQAELQAKRRQEAEAEAVSATREEQRTVTLPHVLTIRDFAVRLNIPVTRLMQTLMNNGILTAMNERIDFDTASIIAQDLGFTVSAQNGDQGETTSTDESVTDVVQYVLKNEDRENLVPRAPIVVIMGHVDHGKTTLLDAIRSSNVAGGESGGITQHIGAYQVEVPFASDATEPQKKKKDGKNMRAITFIDTPGHEAFTTMRSRGARAADVAILVVAADDSVKPQTIEAVKIIKAASLPMVVAINKTDKPEANIDRVKRELSDLGVIPEDWGGNAPCVPISAKQRIGLDSLLEMILLVADMDKDKIVANPRGETLASVIESHIDKNEGAVATVLVQNGTLRHNDYLVIDNILYGKVRAMKDFTGTIVKEATPSQPVRITGFKTAPAVGDLVRGMKELPKDVEREAKHMMTAGSVVVTPKMSDHREGMKFVNVILKADKLGSLEAIAAALTKIEHPEARVNVVSKELGNITSTDVLNAEATKSYIAGFQVATTPGARDIASEKHVDIKNYKIIYELLDDVKERMEKLLSPEISRVVLGKIKILAIFKEEGGKIIAGGQVTGGTIERGVKVTVLRNSSPVGEGKLKTLQSGKQEINKAISGQEFGMLFEGKVSIAEGDVLEAYKEESQKRTIDSEAE